ncbi:MULTISPECIES: gamma-glutamylcyclotransferase family protein [unclassified Mesorhizobium]|uniref:gamma-glutamylcyclotransferase family protein n=1 Tax=unclassified Mesorhizobium TaxID=325217 RepID=UPI001CCCAFB3|nr:MULTISPECIES: gamma-glutamylcyclotransferase family protein [unclassified Mesorhizobium]MBZ9742012.1 gamma-glutamylcyclotransferase [Mesorhizobium sp. CO1-1-4]MBZ9806039.1 gamma-glutamylcyclotransferase [Mesorhizobium sp. ES1-6]
MDENLFVFGTLKRGFPLHARGLSGARFLGAYKTRQRLPMLVAGPRFAPMMFNEPGTGYQVLGELYSVDAKRLVKLDRLESIGKPGNLRECISVEPIEGGQPLLALAYFKARHLAEPVHTGYLDCYVDRRFIPFETE